MTGKRKTAIARAILRSGSGNVVVNGIPLRTFTPEIARIKITEPLVLSGERWKALDFNVKVSGGGFMGQAEAARMAVANGLVTWTRSSELRKTMINYDRTMLAGDPVGRSRRSSEALVLGDASRNRTGRLESRTMIIPIRCFTCGKLIADRWEEFAKRVKDRRETEESA